ncbi:hypothetical protein [Burkholderia anthina]|uniref:hypothetical protein n=1 Tax=Burkholderia anthina TaxID=179879 RepID=UPI001AA0AA4D|nr:hypothetical protein [Burkholderia anthina]QTD92278.1 hypothetical protein J4G50_29040 [Burkholderia anthina]
MDRKAGALAVYREYLTGMTIVLARCEWIGFFADFVFHSIGRVRVSLAIFSRMNQLRSGFDAAGIV